ncbi:hypothetical protein BEWA_000960 [Theileria equi strain WA]|uniref:Uncharacterized protein n=1 Tax=Theileria equi strain WA TaxID=1537102 RepID=L0B0A0_THEEQ|nr:hypothetical protein BEWA_000960 [Theileria equi strain WA]AFZ80691.1 hypothetical protein BEWA_000960 [Theileria equi strain WA]|eukprot:XP_004830357.1 hypothetical protein BEWA_000960 [Theileria equi strain WA]
MDDRWFDTIVTYRINGKLYRNKDAGRPWTLYSFTRARADDKDEASSDDENSSAAKGADDPGPSGPQGPGQGGERGKYDREGDQERSVVGDADDSAKSDEQAPAQ